MTDQEQPDLGGELAADHDAARVVVEVSGDGNSGFERDLLATIRQLVRVKGGGDVQRAFGFVRPQMSTFTPAGYQGAAQHTYTASCDGLHGPGPCPERQQPAEIKVSGGVRLPSLGGGNRG